MNFTSMPQADVPQGRKGKHNAVVTRILSDLDQLGEGVALKVPLAQLAEGKEKVPVATLRPSLRVARLNAERSRYGVSFHTYKNVASLVLTAIAKSPPDVNET
jgi:hypothetical protein